MKKLLIAAALCAAFSAHAYADDAGVHDFIMSQAKPVIMARGVSKSKPKIIAQAAGGRVVHTSWYGGGEKLSKHNADGSRFNPGALTVAHRSLPFGTRVQLSYGGRTVIAVVRDRGPAAWTGRSLDVSRGVAARLGFIGQGTANVRMAVL